MRYANRYCIYGKRDVLEADVFKEEDLLLLNKHLIENELLKIEKKCPIRIAEINGKQENVLIVNKELEMGRYTSTLILYIPDDVIIPVGGVDGKYYIKTLGKWLRNGLTDIRGFWLCKDDRILDEMYGSYKELMYGIGKSYACLGKYFITKNIILPMVDGITVYPKDDTGYFIIKEEYEKATGMAGFMYYVYDNNGTCVSVEHIRNQALSITNEAPKLIHPELPKNTKIFESMIVNALKDIKEFQHCNKETLLDIVDYIESKGFELAINLDSLEVYDINYKKYFERQNDAKKLKYKLK